MVEKITERMELFARIIRLEANYTLEEPDKVNEDYMYIYQNSTRFEKYLEYGFFLRNSEFVKTPLNIIEDLKKSIVHFETFNANKQAVSSRITLGVYYSLLGNYKQAEYQFKIADSKKEEFVGLYDMILTNQAVLMQYQGTLEGIKSYSGLGKMPEGLYHPIHTDEPFTLGDIDIHPFEISHDANEPAGYRLECGAKSVAVATDLGKYDSYTVKNLQNLDAVLLEANHDIHMLEVGGYPYYLKQRILGDRGHLSNELSGQLLCDILHDNLKHIMLGHLSRENNYAKLAYETVKLEVTLAENEYKGEDLDMFVASRDSVSEIVTV